MVWGFQERQVAEVLRVFAKSKLMTGQSETSQAPMEVRDNTGGLFLAFTPVEGIPAATVPNPAEPFKRKFGSAQCQLMTSYSPDDQSFIQPDGVEMWGVPQLSYTTAAQYGTDEPGWQNNADSYTYIYNTFTSSIAGGEFILAANVDGVMLAIPPETERGIVCKTVTAIPARSGTTSGSASDVKRYECGDSGELSDTGLTVTAYNIFGSQIAADTYITCKWVKDKWVVDAEDC